MLYHNTCNGYVLANITPGFKVISSFGLSEKSLTVSVLEIRSEDAEIPTSFVCPECSNKPVTLSEIHACCMECGKVLTLDQAFKIRNSPAILCREHAEMISDMFPGTRTYKRLLDIVATIKILK